MPRKKNEERLIGKHTDEQMRTALNDIKNGKSIRQAAKDNNIPFATLHSYSKKTNLERLTPNYAARQIFTAEQEKALHDYFVKCSLMFYGLTAKDCRKVAYEMAKYNNVAVPSSWEREKKAGLDWLRGFRERNKDITLRKPENCSLARATAFNRETVKKFYDNLESVIKRNPIYADGTRTFNLDETATTTVQKCPKIIALKGRRNVCKVSCGEKGTLVTTCNIICAAGYALPPAIVFPRKHTNSRMKKGGVPFLVGKAPGSEILASPSGWTNSELFLDVMRHYIKRSGSSTEFPSILILDNHESHLSIQALDLAKECGVTILTLHPHTSAKLQPLDVGIHGPFKTYYSAAMESWMMENPGCPVTIYDVGGMIGQAFEKSMTPQNIKNAFRKTGIFPFDRDTFCEEDFLPSFVTDRPEPSASGAQEADSNIPGPAAQEPSTSAIQMADGQVENFEDDLLGIPLDLHERTPSPSTIRDLLDSDSIFFFNEDQPNTSHIAQTPSGVQEAISGILREIITNVIERARRMILPHEFRNPLKAAARKNKRKPRQLGRSLIATDTPEKNLIMEQQKTLKRKKEIKSTGKKKQHVRKVLQSDDSDDGGEPILADDSDGENWLSEEESIITEESLRRPLPALPKEGQYVLVEFASKKQKVYYAAKVLEERNCTLDIYVSFLRHKKGQFTMPAEPDLAYVKDDSIKLILPKPNVSGSTARQQSYLKFDVDMSCLNIH